MRGVGAGRRPPVGEPFEAKLNFLKVFVVSPVPGAADPRPAS